MFESEFNFKLKCSVKNGNTGAKCNIDNSKTYLRTERLVELFLRLSLFNLKYSLFKNLAITKIKYSENKKQFSNF